MQLTSYQTGEEAQATLYKQQIAKEKRGYLNPGSDPVREWQGCGKSAIPGTTKDDPSPPEPWLEIAVDTDVPPPQRGAEAVIWTLSSWKIEPEKRIHSVEWVLPRLI